MSNEQLGIRVGGVGGSGCISEEQWGREGKRRKGKNGENEGENNDGIYVGMNVLRGGGLKNGKMCNN